MTNISKIDAINNYIDEDDYLSAYRLAAQLTEDDLMNGRAIYQLARISAYNNDVVEAYRLLQKAMSLGYREADCYFLMAQVAVGYEDFETVDGYFNSALQLTDDSELLLGIESFQAIFYLQSEKYILAEKAAKRIIEKYPERYEGYHILVSVAMRKEKYEDAYAYLDLLSDTFSENQQYLFDRLEVLKANVSGEKVISAIKSDERYMKMIPIYSLKQKLSYYYNQQDPEKYFEIVKELAEKYNDHYAYFAVLATEFMQQHYQQAAKIACALMELEKDEQGYLFYLSVYYLIFCYFFLSDKKPSLELMEWISIAGEWCVGFARRNASEEAADEVENSIIDLFKEIDENMTEN